MTMAQLRFSLSRAALHPRLYPWGTLLTPNVAFVNRTVGAPSFGNSITAIDLERPLTESSGQTIWADATGSEGSGSVGGSTPEKVLKGGMKDLVTKSQYAMSSSEAIRQFANKQQQ